ncbi:hypothetical protein [Roseimaritima ulvae]|uniref:hypothetical protein n=1 Tax=Roseimaritima ulvae TaxID=980254 RepID=UPI0012F86D4A|nr:hypothetical protein [Roseimaritima ulvae]
MNRLGHAAQQRTLPVILSRAVFQMSTGYIRIDLADDEAELIIDAEGDSGD